MKKDIKVSIVVPVYNLEKEIENCVTSILTQSYQNLEVILVDDGSTDSSRSILKKIKEKDARIILIFKENGGVTSARLAGVKIATGEYIGFVDGDDWIETDMYKVLVDNAVQNEADISHCGYQINFEDGRTNYFYNTGCFEVQDKVTALKALLKGEKIEPALGNKLYRTNLFYNLLQKGVMDQSVKINEDLLMNYYLFSNATVSVYNDLPLYHYVSRSTSVSKQKLNENMIFDPIKVRKIIAENAEKELEDTIHYSYVMACINVYNTILRAKYWKYKKELKMIKGHLKENEEWVGTLNNRQFLVAKMILNTGICYRIIYRIYFKYIMNNRYE